MGIEDNHRWVQEIITKQTLFQVSRSRVLSWHRGPGLSLILSRPSPPSHLVSDDKKTMYNARNNCPGEEKFRHFQNFQIFGSFYTGTIYRYMK